MRLNKRVVVLRNTPTPPCRLELRVGPRHQEGQIYPGSLRLGMARSHPRLMPLALVDGQLSDGKPSL